MLVCVLVSFPFGFIGFRLAVEVFRFNFVHWRLLSLFNMRALEPILSVIFFLLISHSDTFSFSGWLIYHFDYWPLYALEYLVWDTSDQWMDEFVVVLWFGSLCGNFLFRQGTTNKKKHTQTHRTKDQTHIWEHQIERATFFYDRMQISGLRTPAFYRIKWTTRTSNETTREEKKHQRTHLMTDIL